jgi:hypothetical protein
LINPHHVGVIRPRVRVVDGGHAVFRNCARAILRQQSKLRGATRTSVEPHDERISRGTVTGLEHPVKVILVNTTFDMIITRLTLDGGVAESLNRLRLESTLGEGRRKEDSG